MFRWYQEAEVCYAYLADIPTKFDIQSPGAVPRLAGSNWWTRGWTLQELIAPKQVVFFDRKWTRIGDRHRLSPDISEFTGIEESVLRRTSHADLRNYSIGKRMSWAAERETTREEDLAYSLLGIFDIAMPLLYGEGGDKAFLRLQEEMIRTSEDHTIFAWPWADCPCLIDVPSADNAYYGLLAHSPKAFKSCRMAESASPWRGRPPYAMTNRGLYITLHLSPYSTDRYSALLGSRPFPKSGRTRICLMRLEEDDQYVRIDSEVPDPDTMERIARSAERIPLYVKQLPSVPIGWFAPKSGYTFQVDKTLLERSLSMEDLFRVTQGTLDKSLNTVTTPPGQYLPGTVCTIDISAQKKHFSLISLGFDFEFNPIVLLASEAFADHAAFLDAGDLSTGWNRIDFDEGIAYPLSDTTRSTGKLLWKLKGDRVNGFNVALQGVTISDNLEVRVKLKKARNSGRIVWDFKIENMPRTKKSASQFFNKR